ncbi:heterokaryon incompatibility protein-domain-containing protein [Ampelomyces quisqualis]|uniref:Heterokaryon incompatibility protein-domain-containing protein n=1 Tax=Ampelomyces quisqualis TaxID=50730 RepID=A0A6A5QJZ9_AMPQU|nr:heterokaryon incompatibility protein-domain-containing protein [Ampelomyces quisqualis]
MLNPAQCHVRPPKGPHTPDHTFEFGQPPVKLPPSPDSVASDARSVSPSNHNLPVNLQRKTWASPQKLSINKLRLKEPRGIPQSRIANGSRWASTLRKVGAVYNYTRIPSNQVRLLLLKPGNFEDDLCISLITVDDAQVGSEQYPYCALSYHWGEGTPDNIVFVQEDPASRTLRTVEDVVDANRPKKLTVKPNLAEALRHLRDESIIVSLWVDAICINQFDEEEKNEQVMKMALIYSKAYNVNIWLGSDDTETDSPVSYLAMSFIPKVIDPNIHAKLLGDEVYVKSWASLFELLRWSWFSRRWVIQELALARNATVHCGKHVCLWTEFQTAIAIFDRYFDTLKPKLIKYFATAHPDRWTRDDESMFRIKHLGAKLLVDMSATLFRSKKNGDRESTKGLETLVCSLSGFDTSDPRDTINALRNISRELNRPDSEAAKLVPAPDYGKDLFEVYRDFVEWVVTSSKTMDILCRFWALKERKTPLPTTPRLVVLPSWIQFVEDSAWGKGEDVFNGRQAGDSFVGLPDDHNYYASGQGGTYRTSVVQFSKKRTATPQGHHSGSASPMAVKHDMSILVRGVMMGKVSFRTDPFPDGIITKECLVRLGWSFDKNATTIPEVPDQLWQTLVADRGPDGKPTPSWYKSACQSILAHQSNNGHINIDKILHRSSMLGQPNIMQAYLQRVKGVTWNRSFVQAKSFQKQDQVEDQLQEQLVGFSPPKTEVGDMIVILFGCSVPVVLRPTYNAAEDMTEYHFIGEAYIYGKMDGEALDEGYGEQDFRLV